MLLLSTQGALAEALRVDAMRLSPDAAWRRGDAAQEKEDGVYLLEWPLSSQSPGRQGAFPEPGAQISSRSPGRPKNDLAPSGGGSGAFPEPGAQLTQGVALQVALPRQATPLKADAAGFYANLRKKWVAQYGKRAEIGEIEIGAVRWLVCRRPAGDGNAIVFQFATVHEGRAYSLLAFAAPQAAGLPQPVHDLLAGVGFGGQARHWIASRVVSAQPGREALEALVQADAERLGQNGMLTGYGLEVTRLPDAAHAGQALAWFMEGFKWRQAVGRDERLPVSLRGHLEARVPARMAGTLAVSVHLATESNSGVEAEVSLLDLCAPAAELNEVLDRLERGARAPLERLARERPAACPALPDTVPAKVLLAQSGTVVTETLEFSVPPAPPLAAGLAGLKVVAVRPRLAASEDDLGQSLLRQLGLYFIYAPE
jgi:hypothetical protein